MYCHKCGTQISSEDKFCKSCGERVKNNKIIENDEIKIEQINSVKNSNKKILIIGIIICIFIVLCLGFAYFKFMNKSDNTNESRTVETTKNNDNNSTSNTEKTPDLNKEAHKEKEVFAKLLKSKKWLEENTDYEKSPNFIKFLILDIDQDGISEMLLYHGDSGGLAGLTLSVVSYDINTDSVNIHNINVSHGEYKGYLGDKKTIVTGAMIHGDTFMFGYKLDAGRYLETFSASDNTGGVGSENKIVYTLNDNNVSKDEYHKFIDPVQSNLTYTEMYSINDENIKKVSVIDPNTIADDKSIDKYSTLKFKTANQAKEWLSTQDGTFINKKSLYITESSANEIIKLFSQHFVLEKDDYYLFDARYNKNDTDEPMRYLVGKHTGDVYLVGSQSGGYAYLIKNNQVIENLKYDNKESHDWRN